MILFLRQRPWCQYKKIKTIECFSWIMYDISERYILKKRNRWKKEESLKDLFWSCDLIASIRKDLMSRILFWHCPFLYLGKKFYNSLNIRERTVKYLSFKIKKYLRIFHVGVIISVRIHSQWYSSHSWKTQQSPFSFTCQFHMLRWSKKGCNKSTYLIIRLTTPPSCKWSHDFFPPIFKVN